MSQVTFLGACGTVTGSSSLIEAGGARILVDCGLYQGDDELEKRNRRQFAFRPATLDAVVLTHAHLDHVGLLPRLVAQGFSGPIWCTPPTRPLARLVLEDAGEIQEEEARYARKKGYSRHAEPEPLYTSKDARAACERLEPMPFHEAKEIRPGFSVRFVRAGHLLGAGSVEITAKGGDGVRRSWIFSGDVGRYDAPILQDPEPPAVEASGLVLESTYGDRTHAPVGDGHELAEVIHRTLGRGGSVILPAFALGRTQDLLFRLTELVDAGELDPEVVFLDSPMAIRATEIYRQASPEFDEETVELVRRKMNPLAANRFQRARTVAESKALNDRKEPAVIVAASGMATGGRVVHHLAQKLPDPKSTVVFVGYQAAGTRGRALLSGAQTVSIHGRPVAVRAEIAQIPGMSAHADRDELLRWCRALPHTPQRIFLNHGEDPERKALAAAIHELGWPRPDLPLVGDTHAW
ncbi:MAG: MBL fold metallo-hydrolase RNA specificity domain-containing protein [Thermoanaerobaculia bacterium]